MLRALALAVALLVLAGCTNAAGFVAARVPDALLQGDQGNGWTADASRTDAAPRAEGLVTRQTLAYADDGNGGNGGYPATLSLTTLKLTPAPGEQQLRDLLRDQVREHSEQSGIRFDDPGTEGSRTLADGHRTLFFVFTGRVTGQGQLFTTQDATAKILGEVWNCPESGTSVAVVGLAQVSSVQSIGGVRLPAQDNPQNWRELAGDPSGSVDGQREASGLVHAARCA